MRVQVFETHVTKEEDQRFPEAEKYRCLNALGAPVVKLLEIREHRAGRTLVLERAHPLDLDTSRRDDFARLIEHLLDFARYVDEAYPTVDWDYIESYWRATTALWTIATDPSSCLYRPALVDLPDPTTVLARLRELERATSARCISHGDPADFNLGRTDRGIVAFDLGLSWQGMVFRDLALRTGASVSAYPRDIKIDRLVARFADNAGYQGDEPLRHYDLTGAVVGSYFEPSALEDMCRYGEQSEFMSWALLTLSRYEKFARDYAIHRK